MSDRKSDEHFDASKMNEEDAFEVPGNAEADVAAATGTAPEGAATAVVEGGEGGEGGEPVRRRDRTPSREKRAAAVPFENEGALLDVLRQVEENPDGLDALINRLKEEGNAYLLRAERLEMLRGSVSGRPALATRGRGPGRGPGRGTRRTGDKPARAAKEGDAGKEDGEKRQVLWEFILQVLKDSGKPMTLRELADEIPKAGYKTKAAAFANSCRQQLYRLKDDKKVIRNAENKTWALA